MSEGRRYHVGDLPGRLLREARGMLDEGGLKALNLRALAARAGITAGSMYHHYDSKTALLGELAANGFKELRLDLDRASRDAGEGRRVRAWAMAYVGFARRERALFGLMFDDEIAQAAAVAEARAAALDTLRQLVSGFVGDRQLDDATLQNVTTAIWAATHGAASLAGTWPDRPDLVDEVIAGLDALFRGAQRG
ncbi:MAG: TetR/AcrR family transcriptional regulator [Pseudomonadota bacterium]